MIPDWLLGVLAASGVLAAHLAIGVTYARSRAVETYRRHMDTERRLYPTLIEHRPEMCIDSARRRTTEDLRVAALAWPVHMLVAFFGALDGRSVGLIMAPVDQREAKAAKLRADAATWEAVAEHPDTTASERDMATELAKVLRESAKREGL
jgi:hypothetical protein